VESGVFTGAIRQRARALKAVKQGSRVRACVPHPAFLAVRHRPVPRRFCNGGRAMTTGSVFASAKLDAMPVPEETVSHLEIMQSGRWKTA
jgi:hypothetical protein